MFTDILKKYLNIFIIILYVYILYSYDFKDNIQLLLVVTSVFIYIIYNNKGNSHANEIIEGLEGASPSASPTGSGDILFDALDRDDDGLLSPEELRNPTATPSIPDMPDMPDMPDLPQMNMPNINLNLGGLNLDELVDGFNEKELTKLKKRIIDLENKMSEMGEEEHVSLLREKIMDLEIENDKWNQKGDESKEGGDNLKERKTRSFSNYKTTTPMGMYDGMCLDHLKKENVYDLADEEEVNTFLGTTLPLNIKKTDHSKLNGPSVDGNDSSPKRLNMFETNKTSLSCCENSPYLSSNGCVCITSDQEDYLVNRGGNHV